MLLRLVANIIVANVMVLLFLWTTPLSAAGPISHLFFSEIILGESSAPFLVGTSFPDIHYLGEITRDQTHEWGVSLEEVLQTEAEDPFLAGMRFHSFVDEKRWQFVENSEIWTRIQEIEPNYPDTFLKLIEDELIYHMFSPKELDPLFCTVYEDELQWGVSAKCIEKWHKIIRVSLSLSPSQALKWLAFLQQGMLHIPKETIKRWSKQIDRLTQEEEFVQHVESLKEYFQEQVEAASE